MKNGKLLAGIITGLGAGALLGILFAPDKGSKTRKKFLKGHCDTPEDGASHLHDIMRKSKKKAQQKQDKTDLSNSVM